MSTLASQGAAVKAVEARTATVNPDDDVKTVRAFRVVLAHAISDAFALSTEESLWVRHHLAEALKPLETLTPSRIPIAVRKELLEKSYSKSLDMSDMSNIPAMPLAHDGETSSASLADWTGVLMETITHCYSLRPMTESLIYGRINGILREIGVGDTANPRASRYLPNAVKARLRS